MKIRVKGLRRLLRTVLDMQHEQKAVVNEIQSMRHLMIPLYRQAIDVRQCESGIVITLKEPIPNAATIENPRVWAEIVYETQKQVKTLMYTARQEAKEKFDAKG